MVTQNDYHMVPIKIEDTHMTRLKCVAVYYPIPIASASNKRSITLGPRQLSNLSLSGTNSIPYASHHHSRLEEAQCMRIKIT